LERTVPHVAAELEREGLNVVIKLSLKLASPTKSFLTGIDVTDDFFGENFPSPCSGGGRVGDLYGFARARHS
jgi:hypothetical protein